MRVSFVTYVYQGCCLHCLPSHAGLLALNSVKTNLQKNALSYAKLFKPVADGTVELRSLSDGRRQRCRLC